MSVWKSNYKHYFGICALLLTTVFVTGIPAQAQTSKSKTAAHRYGQPKSNGKSRKRKNVTTITKNKQSNTQPVPSGEWGAAGIALTVTADGGQLRFDCADGEITQKLMLDADGNFTAEGVYVQQTHGPIRIDSPPTRQAVRYEGRVSGTQMNLKITATDGEKTIGEFTLENGVAARIHRCY